MAAELIQLAFGRLRVRDRGVHARRPGARVVTPKAQKRLEPTLARVRDHLDYMIANAGPYPFGSYGSLVSEAGFPFALETQTLSLFGAFGRRPARRTSRSWSTSSRTSGTATASSRRGGAICGSTRATRRGSSRRTCRTGSASNLDRYRARGLRRRATGCAGCTARSRSRATAPATSTASTARWSTTSPPSALYALRQEIGDTAFRTLLREWPQRNAGRAVTTADYIALASEIAGRDLGPFLTAWLYGTRQPPMPGHPDW